MAIPIPSALSVAVLSIAIALYAGIGHESQYVFDPLVMKSVAVSAIARAKSQSSDGVADPDLIIAHVVDDLRKLYKDYVVDEPEWMFNNAGGAMGAMRVGS